MFSRAHRLTAILSQSNNSSFSSLKWLGVMITPTSSTLTKLQQPQQYLLSYLTKASFATLLFIVSDFLILYDCPTNHLLLNSITKQVGHFCFVSGNGTLSKLTVVCLSSLFPKSHK